MNRSWLLYIALGVAIFVAITYAIFFYWNIDNNNKWSTFFSFISAFSIFATIGVYLLQRKDNKNAEKELTNKKNKSISDVLILECRRISDDLKYIKKMHEHITKQKSKDGTIDRNGDYTHITIARPNKSPLNFYILKINYDTLNNLLILSINSDNYYSETIYSIIYSIVFINEKIESWLVDENSLFRERVDLIHSIIELEEDMLKITSNNHLLH
ncbi:MAG TPA: hypothetical protein DIS95_01200 [Proteus vulgaris]|uniref:hypothetical protein n=1 Tax=Proteus TaxID=583 RepID=UPI00019D0293|nr:MULTISPECIES: hypothetical protein [Proteus]EEI47916.1 hypothetical protein HMPREF0693_2171 [Proteus mirabilis ATCC 29906]MBI6412938.1 hypothetical protein [Proteus mirabilis]MCR1832314.1 hypothetical protein [Proteus mirabilis]MDM3703265.1 hypothetical protein [Proteus mirabilis]HBC7459922.1 hypothetical protein [Proteus mirabilis]